MPRKCAGTIEGELCQFSKVGGPTQPKPGQIRCVCCCPEAMQQACGTEGGLLRLAQLLRGMPEASRNLALRRLPEDTHEEHFEAEFGAQFKRLYPGEEMEELDASVDFEAYVDSLPADGGLEADIGEFIQADGLPESVHYGGNEDDDINHVEDDLAEVDATMDLGEELPAYEPEPFEPLLQEDQEEEEANNECEQLEEPELKKRPAANSRAKAAGQIKKKPAARRPYPNELCPGRNGEPCIFSASAAWSPAAIHPKRGQKHCMFCDPAELRKAMSSKRPKVLPTWKKISDEAKKLALTRMARWEGEEKTQEFKDKAEKARPNCAPQDWKQLLEARQMLRSPLEEGELSQYEKAMHQDRQRARRKVLCPEYKGKHGTRKQTEKELAEIRARCGEIADVAENDCGLPAPEDPTARMVEAWCKRGSWAMCEACHSLQPQNLEPMDLKRVKKATISSKQCTACKHQEYVPTLADVPVALRHLAPEVLQALRPLDINTGGVEDNKCLLKKSGLCSNEKISRFDESRFVLRPEARLFAQTMATGRT